MLLAERAVRPGAHAAERRAHTRPAEKHARLNHLRTGSLSYHASPLVLRLQAVTGALAQSALPSRAACRQLCSPSLALFRLRRGNIRGTRFTIGAAGGEWQTGLHSAGCHGSRGNGEHPGLRSAGCRRGRGNGEHAGSARAGCDSSLGSPRPRTSHLVPRPLHPHGSLARISSCPCCCIVCIRSLLS